MGNIPRLKRGEKLLIATHNAGKLAELQAMLASAEGRDTFARLTAQAIRAYFARQSNQ